MGFPELIEFELRPTFDQQDDVVDHTRIGHGDGQILPRLEPAVLAGRDWSSVIRELLDNEHSQADWEERIAISIACHSAVRAGQVLTDDEMREIVRQLEQTAIPHSCPHGRPTMIHLSLSQLGKEFGRS